MCTIICDTTIVSRWNWNILPQEDGIALYVGALSQGIVVNLKDGKKDGLVTSWLENGQKSMEGHWKEDKWHGLWVVWHENGQKWFEEIYKDGKMVEGSAKYWNSKGEPVDSKEEALEE